jgi:hypothetical protein
MAKKLVKSRDWHGWAWKWGGGVWAEDTGAAAYRTKPTWKPLGVHKGYRGKWVRVKFVEVGE